MNNPSQPGTCPQCHARLPADAPQGLCPACLLAAVALPTEGGPAAAPKAPPPTREQVAAAFPQLEIIELIGAGGMGYVFKARQPKLDRLVALKLLPPQLGADAAFAGRFEREGRLLARLNHPNIVTVHDFGFASFPLSTSSSGFFYLLMEYVDGVNLRQVLRAGRFTSAQALAIVPKICEALQFAHEQGVLHRDIKPENILLDSKGRVKLADFGIAKLIGPDAAAQDLVEASNPGGRDSVEPAKERSDAPPQTPDPRPQTLPSPSGLTSATAALGTPSYMAPEQRARPAEVDHRADIYSLGVVFYEMLTGELPVGQFAPPSAKSPGDPRVDEVVLRALEQERERRQQSAGEMKTQVETIASSAGGSRRNETPTISPTPSVSDIVPALSPALRWSFKIAIAFLFVAGGFFTWQQGSVFARGEIGFNFGVLLLPAAFGLHHRRAGWRTCALVFLWFEAIVTAIAAASRLTNPYEPVIRLGYTPLTTSETWWENALWAAGYWWLARGLSQPQIKAQFSTACRIPRWKDWVVLPVALLLACAASRVYPPSTPSAIVHFGCVPVGVSNNVVFVDVNTEVFLKSLELRAELTGEGLSSTTEAAAKDYATAVSGTFIYPELHGSNALARILLPGRQTWRLGFVLPSAVLAQEAASNLRRIGPLRAEPPEASRDTLFEIHRPYGVMYRASLQVVPVDHPDQLKPPKLLFEPTSLQQPDPTPKFFTLARFTNMNGHATAWVETPLEPGESARTYLVHPDGRREPAPVMEFQNRNSLRERTTLSWRWQLPPPFTTERVDEVVAQLRDRWQGKPLSCPPGKSVNLFTLTNEFGAQVAGEVVFDRVVPDPTQLAVAAVRVRRISSLSSFISINVGSTVPVGYALRASCTGSGISRGDSSLVRSSSSDDHCTWMWPGTDFAGELAQAAVRQVQEQMARSPWLLTNGQPRTVFSVTNTTGEVYAGQLELRGATRPITRVPSPPIQPSRPIESKSPKPTALEPAQKQFVPASFTNLQGAAMMRTETPLGPGESAHAWLVHPDGRRERAWTLESLYHGAGTERTMRSWNWRLPTPFTTNQADAVVAQLRARWHGRPLVCPLGQPVTVFTLTNAAGSQVSGEVVFNRTSPNLAKPAVAEVHLQNQVGLLLFFTSQVPAGYSLHIRSGGTASQAAHATLSRSSHKDADDATCSWLWTDAGFDKVAAAKQAAVLFAQGPLLITNGQPRTVFSVTNATGEAYVGQFELRGPDYVPPVASAAPTPPRPGALAPLPLPLPPLPPANLLSDSARPMRVPMPPGYEPPKPSTPEGLALMAKHREQYNQTTNLVVEGFTVMTVLRTNKPAFVTTNQFEIKLGRPSYYLVHWVSSPVGSHVNQGAAWSDGTGDWFTMTGSAPVKNANRGMALGGAVGVSQNASGWLPSLFFGDAAWLQVLGDLRVEPDAVLEGKPCTVLVGSSRDNLTRLWISKQDFLLRQAEFLSTVRTEPANLFPSAGFPVGTTIRTVQTYRRVTTGQALAPADFKFNPPDK